MNSDEEILRFESLSDMQKWLNQPGEFQDLEFLVMARLQRLSSLEEWLAALVKELEQIAPSKVGSQWEVDRISDRDFIRGEIKLEKDTIRHLVKNGGLLIDEEDDE
jgi:hypothetical protein